MTRHALWLFRQNIGMAVLILLVWIVGALAALSAVVTVMAVLSARIGPPAAAITCITIGVAFAAYAGWGWHRAR